MTNSTFASEPWRVVVNSEGRHSVWPLARRLPAGWQAVGEPASRADALEQIEALWRDPRPTSLARALDAEGQA